MHTTEPADKLRRRQRAHHFLAERFCLNSIDKRLDYFEVDVGLEQRDANLPHGGIDIGFGQPALAAQILKDFPEFV